MKKIIRSSAFLGMVMLLSILSSCEKDYYMPETIDIPDNVSYSGDIQPFWNADCVKCHKAGTTPPNLEAGASYDALTSGGYVNTADPESSSIYTKIAPGGSMESYSTPSNTAMVLKWIEDGAQNN